MRLYASIGSVVRAGDVRVGDVLIVMSGRSGERHRRIQRCRVVTVEPWKNAWVAITVAPTHGGWTTYKHTAEGVAIEREAGS